MNPKTRSKITAVTKFQAKNFTTNKTRIQNKVQHLVMGMNHIFNSNNHVVYRLSWLLIICCSFVVCVFQITGRVKEYLKRDTEFLMDVKVNRTVDFPAISVCMMKAYGSAKLKQHYAKEHKQADWCGEAADHAHLLGYKGNDNIYDLWLTYKTADILNTTWFPRAKVLKDPHVRQWFFPSYLGICETIDISGNPIQYEDGETAYFEISTTDFLKDYPCQFEKLKIMVHSPNESIRHNIHREGFDVAYGSHYNILIHNQKVIFINTSKNPCYSEEEFYKCEDICIDTILTQNQTCRLPYIVYTNLSYCTDAKAVDTFYALNGELYKGPINCSSCGRKCSEDAYRLAISPFAVNKTNILLRLYYEDNVLVSYTEVISYTIEQCISAIGGSLGLFLGLCVLGILAFTNEVIRLLFCSSKVHPRINNDEYKGKNWYRKRDKNRGYF